MNKRGICIFLLFALLLFPTANAQDTTISTDLKAMVWDGQLFVEGRRAFLVDENENAEFALCYKGSVYIPADTIANWLGMKEYLSNKKSIALTATGESIVSSWETQGSYDASKKSQLNGSEVQERVDIPVFLNNKKIQMQSSNGYSLYPIEVNNLIYLPIRSICELANFEVTWASDADGEQYIYVQTPLSNEEKHQIVSYLETGFSICDQMCSLKVQLSNTPHLTHSQIDAISQEYERLLIQLTQLREENEDLRFLKYCNNAIGSIQYNRTKNLSPGSFFGETTEEYLSNLGETIDVMQIYIRLELRKLRKAFLC